METRKCPYCGKTILAMAKTCKHCRQSFVTQAEGIIPETPVQEPIQETPPFVEQQATAVQQNTNPSQNSKNVSHPWFGKNAWWILGIVGFIVGGPFGVPIGIFIGGIIKAATEKKNTK